MTSAAKPLPAHGTYARANGCPGYREPCKCQLCLDARRAAKKRERVNRQLGRPAHLDATQARTRLRQLNETMGWDDLAKAVESSASHLREIAHGRLLRVKRTTHTKIMAVEPTPTGGQFVDATGSIRRCRALHAIGHTALAIADAADTNRSRILPLLDGYPRLRRSVALRIETAYDLLSNQPGTNTRARNRSLKEGWAPPGAWDDDTIDNPDAHPEWTGHCGTDHGWWIHRRQDLPMCRRCEQAHQQWLDDHSGLHPQERNKELFRARAAAGRRESDLAADARELFQHGADVEQAAARLGVTRPHLHQILKRHPDLEAAA